MSEQIDRRDALKRAAAAGAIGFTAPMIVAERASAVDLGSGGFTTKCGPQGTAQFVVNCTSSGGGD